MRTALDKQLHLSRGDCIKERFAVPEWNGRICRAVNDEYREFKSWDLGDVHEFIAGEQSVPSHYPIGADVRPLQNKTRSRLVQGQLYAWSTAQRISKDNYLRSRNLQSIAQILVG